MTRVDVLAGVVLGVLAWPRAAAAQLPHIPFCSTEHVMVGSPSGAFISVYDPFVVTIRDINNQPMNQYVTLKFGSTPIRITDFQDFGVTWNCAARTASKYSAVEGRAEFTPRFGGFVNSEDIEVWVAGSLLGKASARSVDIDGLDGRTSLNDFAIFSQGLATQSARPELNFDQSASDVPDLGDFATFAREIAASITVPYCP